VAYRVDGDTLDPADYWTPVGPVIEMPSDPGHYYVNDTAQLVNGQKYTYFAVATYVEGVSSEPSNRRWITAFNDPLTAGGDSYSTPEDTRLVIPAPGVLSNDGDPDSPVTTLTAVLESGPSKGTLSLNTNGSFTYTPEANYFGNDSFRYRASATYGSGAPVFTAPVTVEIAVTAVNDAPVAVNDSYPMPTTGALSVSPRGVLANDTDVESAPSTLTAVRVTGPSRGSLELLSDGSFTYTPTVPVTGSDSFTYQARDEGGALSNVATVRIAAYTLVGLQNVPPAVITKTKAGSSVPMKWQFRDGSLAVDSGAVHHSVTIYKDGSIIKAYSDTDPGGSSFRYDATTKTWYFNLQTKEANGTPYLVGDYEIKITPGTAGYLPSDQPFILKLTK